MTPSTTPEQRYARLVDDLGSEDGVTYEPPATGRASFGTGALKVGGKIFAMPIDGRLVVKLPKPRVDALVDSGDGERLVTGRVMKEWLVLSPTSRLRWPVLAREALEFVRG